MPAFVVLCGHYTISPTSFPPRQSIFCYNNSRVGNDARRELRQGLAWSATERSELWFTLGLSLGFLTTGAFGLSLARVGNDVRHDLLQA